MLYDAIVVADPRPTVATFTGCPIKVSTQNHTTFKPGFSQIIIRVSSQELISRISSKFVMRIRRYDHFCATGSHVPQKAVVVTFRRF